MPAVRLTALELAALTTPKGGDDQRRFTSALEVAEESIQHKGYRL